MNVFLPRGTTPTRQRAFTLVEIVAVIAILAVVASISIPSYSAYLVRARMAQARADITMIDSLLANYELTHNGALPDSLADVGGGPVDPWGNPYEFLNLRDPSNLNRARMDHNLHPINTDYDLYSKGPDGRSVRPLTAMPSRDDIVRGRNGRFIGIASDF